MPDQFVTTKQVADHFGCDVTTVGRWVRAGRLTPVAKLPGDTGAYLFAPDVLDTPDTGDAA